MALSDFPEKIFVPGKMFSFLSVASPNVALTPTDQSCSNSIFKVLLQLSPTRPFNFGPTLNIKGTLILRVVHNKKQETTWVKTWNFTNVINCFCCFVIKSAGEIAKKVLSVIGNPLRIKINLSQIMTFSIKREKVCAVCPYLLLLYILGCIDLAWICGEEQKKALQEAQTFLKADLINNAD